MIWTHLHNGLLILAVTDEIHVIYKLAPLLLHIPEFIIIKTEKCFSTKGPGAMVVDIIVIRTYTGRHTSIQGLYPSSLVPEISFSDSQSIECFEMYLYIHGPLAVFTPLYLANI